MFLLRFIYRVVSSLISFIFLLLIIVMGCAWWFGPKIAPGLINEWVEQRTGFSSTVDEMGISWHSGVVNMEGFSLLNPSSYQDRNFVNGYGLMVDFDMWSLLGKKVVIEEAVVDLKNVTWVLKENGDLNVKEFLDGFLSEEQERVVKNAGIGLIEGKVSLKGRDIVIKKLTVKLEHFYAVGMPGQKVTKEHFFVNYSREFVNVEDFNEVYSEIVLDLGAIGVKMFSQGFFKNLGEGSFENSNGEVSDLGKKLNDIGGRMGRSVKKRARKVFDFLKEI